MARRKKNCVLENCGTAVPVLVFVFAMLFSVFAAQKISAQNPKTITATSTTNLSAVLNREAGLPANQQIAANDTVRYTKTVPLPNPNNPVITDDTHDYNYISVDNVPMTGGVTANPAYTLEVNKTGSGLWRLAGANVTSANSNQLTVGGGTLELMKNGSITLTAAANQSSIFQLNANTVLNIRGADTGGTTITAATINLLDSTKIGLDLTNANVGSPALTLAGNVAPLNATGRELNLLGFRTIDAAKMDLLQFNYAGAAAVVPETFSAPPLRIVNESKANPQDTAYDPNFTLMVRGENWQTVVNAASGRLTGNVMQTTSVGTNNANSSVIYIENFHSQVGTVTWNGGSGNWNATENNWNGTGTTFLHGDAAVFNTGTGMITVQAGGVQIGEDGMTVNGGDYIFTNASDNIGIDGPGGVHAAAGMITFESVNSYWGDTVIDAGAQIILKNTAGLGTSLVNIKGGKLIFDTSSVPDYFYNDIVGSSGGELGKRGTNTLTIYGSNTSNADTRVEAGTLQNNIGSGVLYVYNGATYNAMNKSRNVAGVSDGPVPLPNGGTVNMGTKSEDSDLFLFINVAQYSSYEFSGNITGGTNSDNGATVSKSGKGTQIFSNNIVGSGKENTYSSGTIISDGQLIARESLLFNSSKSSTDADNIYNITPFGSGTVKVNKPLPESSPDTALVFDIAHIVLPPNSVPIPPLAVARVSNKFSGDGKIIKTGDAILSLYGDSTSGVRYIDNYRGEVDVEQGYLRVENNNALGKAEKIVLNDNTALQFLNPNGGNLVGNSSGNPFDRVITGTGNVEVLENTKVYLNGSNAADASETVNGQEMQTGAVIGNSDYTGRTIIYGGGELVIRNTSGTGNTSAVEMVKGDDSAPSPSTFTLEFDKADDGGEGQKYDRYITGKGNLQKTGSGIAYLVKQDEGNISNDYTGRTLIKNGVLKIAYAGATGKEDTYPEQKVEIFNGAKLELAFDTDEKYKKGITGTGALAKSGDKTATLGGKSDYTGGTYIWGGTLSFTNTDTNTAGNLGTGGVYFQHGGGVLQNTAAVDDLNQEVQIDAGSTATFDTKENLTNSKEIYHHTVDSNDPYYNPDDQTSKLVKTGYAELHLDGSAEWTGTTTVKEGWLYNNVPETTDLYVYTGAGYNTGTGKAVIGGQYERTVASIHGEDDTHGGTISVVNGTDLVIKYRDTSKEDVFAGSIYGDGGLVFDADGTTLRLTGANSYKNHTVIRGKNGTLIGNIALNTALEIGSTNTYVSGGKDRQISSLTGSGDVKMENKTLTISQSDASKEPVFNGRILNVYDLIKTGDGAQQLAGNISVSRNIEIKQGNLMLGGLNLNGVGFPATVNVGNDLIVYSGSNGNIPTLTVKKDTTVNAGNNLNIQGQLNFTPDGSLIEAGHSVTLGKNSVLNITGIGKNDKELIIRSKGETIEDNFGTVIIAGSAEPEQDFLYLGVEKSENKKEIWIGQTLRWYADNNAHGTFTLNGSNSYYNIGRELHDVNGTFNTSVWDGKTLTKKGEGTLELSCPNTYTGKTIVEDGILKLTNEKATGGSSEIVLSNENRTYGGTLEINFDSRDRSGNWTEGLTTPISGLGGVKKTGNGYAVLSGNNTYEGRTSILQGVLFVDGSVASDVYAAGGAGFGGNGRVSGNVLLEDNSFYLWRFGAMEQDSDLMTISGRLSIGQNVFFKPLTTLMNDSQIVNADGWTVINYGELVNKFSGVDSSSNPFYNFELDYDTFGKIRIHGTRLDQPRALSDAVATSAGMAQTKMWRTAFRQIQREWSCDCPPAVRQIKIQNDADNNYSRSNSGTRGQSPATYRTAWMQFVGRGDKFESTYFNDPFSFQSYGFQTGISLYSTCDRSFGLMYGREEGQLKGSSASAADKVENEDNYLGFYFARMFQRNFDLLAYVGSGWQKNHLDRFSNERAYAAAFNGTTFNFDFEIGKRFYTQRGSFLRPFFGFDVEIAHLGSANERTMDGLASNEIRNYGSTKLDQVFFKVGLDASRSWRMIDINGGVNLNWNIADDYAKSTIYYPFINKSIDSRSASFGRFNVAMNAGLNWYLTQRRNAAFYIDYQAEIHQDRENDLSSGTGVVGFFWRF